MGRKNGSAPELVKSLEVWTTVVTRRNDDGSASPAGAGIVPI